ncbi:MAG: competence/damage-inducible protein A [Salinivirgaceae bacterium]|nr:MAG: competence/damage-inducible protein A [Salinivirgaceae bacterium]
MNPYRASIVTIGDEILIGQIIDSNSAWLADKLFHLGFKITEIRSISDQPAQIEQTLAELTIKNDLILVTGGLGPTNDDRTKEALNDFFGGKMIMNENVLDDIKSFIAKRRGYLQLSDNNRAQAMVSDVSTVLRNAIGTAPGQLFNHNNCITISMPGVPFEMKHLFENQIIKELEKRFEIRPNKYRTLHVIGYPESELANKLSDWESNIPDSIELAYLPSPGVIRLRLSSLSNNNKDINNQIDKLRSIIGDSIIAEGKEKVEHTIGKLLSDKGYSIAVAESCTGGLLSQRIVSVAGASNYFQGSITAYSNEAKHRLLNVKNETLKQHGAVSKETAMEMAKNVASQFNTDIGISTTGIAGPTGGTTEKPVGTVWIGIYINGEVDAIHFMFTHNRTVIMERSATLAMYEMIKRIKKMG